VRDVTDVVVLADTHLRGEVTRRLPAAALAAIEEADLVLHAGDVVSPEALAELEVLAPTLAVLGNNDHQLVGRLPIERTVELGGVVVSLLHDTGLSAGRAGRLSRRFPGSAVVIFGHSHAPVNEPGLGGQLLFNPGSPTQRRRQPAHTIGHLRLGEGRVLAARIEAV
jgi:putative phosphoesterase